MIDEKYLDPKHNDFIKLLEPGPEDDPELGLLVDLEPSRGAPFMSLDEMAKAADAAALTRAIAERYPGQEELEVGGVNLVLMASGDYTEAKTSRLLRDLGAATLKQIASSIQKA